MRDVLANLQKLPPIAFIDNRTDENGVRRVPNTDADVIAIRRGEDGFFPLTTPHDADWHNTVEGVTPQQREAMFYGSVFGWNTLAADADSYAPDGTMLRPKQEAAS